MTTATTTPPPGAAATAERSRACDLTFGDAQARVRRLVGDDQSTAERQLDAFRSAIGEARVCAEDAGDLASPPTTATTRETIAETVAYAAYHVLRAAEMAPGGPVDLAARLDAILAEQTSRARRRQADPAEVDGVRADVAECRSAVATIEALSRDLAQNLATIDRATAVARTWREAAPIAGEAAKPNLDGRTSGGGGGEGFFSGGWYGDGFSIFVPRVRSTVDPLPWRVVIGDDQDDDQAEPEALDVLRRIAPDWSSLLMSPDDTGAADILAKLERLGLVERLRHTSTSRRPALWRRTADGSKFLALHDAVAAGSRPVAEPTAGE